MKISIKDLDKWGNEDKSFEKFKKKEVNQVNPKKLEKKKSKNIKSNNYE